MNWIKTSFETKDSKSLLLYLNVLIQFTVIFHDLKPEVIPRRVLVIFKLLRSKQISAECSLIYKMISFYMIQWEMSTSQHLRGLTFTNLLSLSSKGFRRLTFSERLPFMCQPPRLVSWTYGPFWETPTANGKWELLWSTGPNASSIRPDTFALTWLYHF